MLNIDILMLNCTAFINSINKDFEREIINFKKLKIIFT